MLTRFRHDAQTGARNASLAKTVDRVVITGGGWRVNARESVRQALAGVMVLLVIGGVVLATPWARPFAGSGDEQLALVLLSFDESKAGLARRCEALNTAARNGPLGFELTGLPSPMAVHKRDPMFVEVRVSATGGGRYALRYLLPEIRGRGVWSLVELLRGPDPIPEGTILMATLQCAPAGAAWGELQTRVPTARLAAAAVAAAGLKEQAP